MRNYTLRQGITRKLRKLIQLYFLPEEDLENGFALALLCGVDDASALEFVLETLLLRAES